MLENVRKRDWRIESFSKDKILNAILRSLEDAAGEKGYSLDFLKSVTENIVENLKSDFIDSSKIPTVDDIGTVVEHFLMSIKAFDLAKAYILKSEEKRLERERKREIDAKKLENEKLKVTKRDGSKVLFDIEKLKQNFNRANINFKSSCKFSDIEEKLKSYLIDNIKTSDLNKLMIKACVDSISVQNINWQYVAWRVALFDLYQKAGKNRDLQFKDIYSAKSYKELFDSYVAKGLYYKDFYKYYSEEDILEAGKHLNKKTDLDYNYTTITMLGKRYLLNPNKVINELPQEMYMSVSLFLAINESKETRLQFALELYKAISTQKISLPTPTLMNARTNFTQLSSCFVLNSGDDLREIYHNIENVAQISKLWGGVGIYLWNIRSQGASIRGIENASGGVLPWVKVLNDTAIAVDQLGQRSGAVSVTLDVWHKDIFGFLDMQTETGDIRRKSFDVFPALSIPDLFMQRVEENWVWTLFDPKEVEDKTGKKLQDFFGEEFETFYTELESNIGKFKLAEQIQAKDLYKKFLKSAVETGMPYIFFRDTANKLNPNKHKGSVYSSQLCTEIVQNTSPSHFSEETYEDGEVSIKYRPGDNVVCNLASINVAKVNTQEEIDTIVPLAMRVLDNVIDLNLYPVKETEITANKYRAVGLGYLWLAEYLATHQIAYDSLKAVEVVDQLFEQFAYKVIESSKELAKERGKYELFEWSEWSKGILLGKDKEWYSKNTENGERWSKLIDEVKEYGLRNGYLMAPAPNTSTGPLVWTTSWLLPIYKKYFVETNGIAPLVSVAPNLDASNFWHYKEYVNMDMGSVIDVIGTISKWVDQSISFEWMINPQVVSPRELSQLYFKAWRTDIKTVYYVRSLSMEVKEGCISCSG